MPFIFVGVALYLIYRYYTQPAQAPAAPPVVIDVDPNGGGGGGQPAAPTGGGGDVPAPPAPAIPSVSWQAVPEGAQLQPGFDYRASAPAQNFLVMSMIPGHLASAGFTNVVIHKPGEAFPNDWPDSGSALRIEATLPSGAQPQTFNLDGVSVWQKVVTQTAGQVAGYVVRHVAKGVYESVNRVRVVRGVPYPKVPVPASNGVFDGLVQRPRAR